MPRYRMSWQDVPPPQAEGPQPPNLARQGADWFIQRSGQDLDRAMAMQALSDIAPELRKQFEYQEEDTGQKKSAQELYGVLRGFHDPGYSGPTGADKALGLGLFAGQFPVAGALGAVAPGLGHVAGWGAMRHAAHLANPEMAGASLAWDVGGAVGAKALGTGASMLYRSKLMPKLAQKGLTSKELHPVASRVLDWAEGATDPLIGPKAKNFGMPRWMNRWLQKRGPQGAAPKAPTKGLPAGQQEIGLPGQKTFPGMRPKTEGKLPKPVSRIQVGDELKYKADIEPVRPAWSKVATTGKRQEDLFRTALEELPPEPEQLTTLSEVGRAASSPDQVAMQAMRGPLPGIAKPVSPQAPGPPPMPSLGPEQASAAKAVQAIVTTVKPGEKLTWKGYATGLKKATGLKRDEWKGVLRIHKALASSYGESPDEMVGRMFRGVMTQAEHVETFPGISKWAGGGKGPVGLAHWMEDGRAILAFSDRVRLGKVKSATQLETALHEPLHVFYKWMPARDKAVLTKALKGAKGEGWTDAQEHQAITWALEYMRSGKAPTKTLATTFERFKSWLNRLLTQGKKGQVPKEVEEVLATMLTPGGYKRRAQESTVAKALRAGKKKG